MNQRIAIACAILAAAGVPAACGRTAGGRASPPTATAPVSAPAPRRCADGAAGADVIVDPARPPKPVCISVGHVVELSTGIAPHHPWSAFASSDPAVLACASARVPGGAVQARCTGRRPGIAVITTGTMPVPGDPHGPAQRIWELTVTVAPDSRPAGGR